MRLKNFCSTRESLKRYFRFLELALKNNVSPAEATREFNLNIPVPQMLRSFFSSIEFSLEKGETLHDAYMNACQMFPSIDPQLAGPVAALLKDPSDKVSFRAGIQQVQNVLSSDTAYFSGWLVYPVFLILFIPAVIFFDLTFIVPNFNAVIRGMNIPDSVIIPTAVKIILNIDYFSQAASFIYILLFILTILFFKYRLHLKLLLGKKMIRHEHIPFAAAVSTALKSGKTPSEAVHESLPVLKKSLRTPWKNLMIDYESGKTIQISGDLQAVSELVWIITALNSAEIMSESLTEWQKNCITEINMFIEMKMRLIEPSVNIIMGAVCAVLIYGFYSVLNFINYITTII